MARPRISAGKRPRRAKRATRRRSPTPHPRAIKSTAEHLALLTSLIVDAARAGAKGLVLRRELIRPRRLADALAASLAGRAEAKGLEHAADISAALPQAVIGDA